MNNVWRLPTSLTISGVGYPIRTDFRDVLHILRYFDEPDYENDEKWMICLRILYKDWKKIPAEAYDEAAKAAVSFIDAGVKTNPNIKKPSTVDWDHDAPILIPAINKALGVEIRTLEYLHWWTFLGGYMEIQGGLFSAVAQIRNKLAQHKKLEKEEQKFYLENKQLIDIPMKYTAAEREEQERLKAILG